MDVKEYIDSLNSEQRKDISFIELNRNKEVEYLRERAYIYERTIQAIPAVSEPLKVLDIGPTPFTMFIKKKFPHYQVWALDRTDLLQQRFQEAGVGLKVCDLDQGIIPFDTEYFDIVIFTEVLEHVFAPPTAVLEEVKRTIRPSGKLALGVPNIARLSNRVKLLVGISPLPPGDDQMKKQWVHGHGHIHEYTKKEIVLLCKSVGFEVLSVNMLTPGIKDLFRTGKKFNPVDFIYHASLLLVPQFRTTIFVECSKQI